MQPFPSDLVWVVVVSVWLFGLVIGSFLNVVIARVPAGLSVVSPRSACPACGRQIRGRDNIPVVSWLVLRGRCRDCAAPIPVRYPLVEVVTATLMSGVVWWAWLHAPALILVLAYLSAVGVALFLIDLDVFRLPDVLVLPSYPVVLAAGALGYLRAGSAPDLQVVWSALVWFAVFAGPFLLTAGRGMGLGDVKLAPLLGAVLGAVGWGASLVGLLAGFLLGSLVGVALMLCTDAGRKTRVPFGPFMLLGALVGLLAGEPVWVAYLSLVGLS